MDRRGAAAVVVEGLSEALAAAGVADAAHAAAVATAGAAQRDHEAALAAFAQFSASSATTAYSTDAGDLEVALPRGLQVSHERIDLVRELGRGGFGIVWLVMVSSMQMAAKKLEGVGSERALLKEALALSLVFHANVVRIMGVCTDPGHRCLLMEYASMGSLRDVLNANPDLPLWRRFELLRDAEKAMCHLHHFKETPLLHRDLKPANLLVFEGWVCKVADFGLAQGVGGTFSSNRDGMTVRYAPPEVLHNEQASTASDVYSYGVTVWEVVTGQRPWREMASPAATITAVISGLRPEIPSDCDPHFAALMTQCWAHIPAERPGFEHIRLLSETVASRLGEGGNFLQAAVLARKVSVSLEDASAALISCSGDMGRAEAALNAVAGDEALAIAIAFGGGDCLPAREPEQGDEDHDEEEDERKVQGQPAVVPSVAPGQADSAVVPLESAGAAAYDSPGQGYPLLPAGQQLSRDRKQGGSASWLFFAFLAIASWAVLAMTWESVARRQQDAQNYIVLVMAAFLTGATVRAFRRRSLCQSSRHELLLCMFVFPGLISAALTIGYRFGF